MNSKKYTQSSFSLVIAPLFVGLIVTIVNHWLDD
ncbi:type I toxin-antitoxin system Fst family toxin [Tetragenococcus halophilus]|uniref:Type I toxin-antitoxin system Fst family toxin n=1 Tax=Tetragenococcus halophilus TaxID=51669 RepID=A0AB35HN82_TETHA|nr:type I toxin-antitoxin system Fst family toxin [Tetragenococcus halophilus]MCO8286421.1 type I toxin-antitoxin system Fst family toxin [Tetragenococcus halophilus]MCO8288188.1 type I toxin-antitoxin system Fst family toxin [Tetragenococcus halophilus]MCO8290961.1 type I toxin-antitoxin system Fst family toxin [Tetragenococcus halophilus]MCO8295420.1 type I toxin-antitoxin system Fst family toxin [Tetragenococcus halophilus]